VHISTDEVHGSVEVDDSSEEDRLEARTPYSATNAESDLTGLSYFTTYGLPVTGTRLPNKFGPCQCADKDIPLFSTNLIDGASAVRRTRTRRQNGDGTT
jgi:dTDP-glucose 4,6-dehydratase